MKNRTLPLVSLREVLIPVSRPERVDASATYNILGAHWYAKGLYTKDILSGSQIQATQVFRVEKNDFVYNRLFGWKGSFAFATEENHGCYVSNEFPCFAVSSDRADGRYLWNYFSQAAVWDEVLALSAGGTPTSRNRLKESQLLGMKIPLPSVDEQRRIVARIEELATKIDEASQLRSQSAMAARAILDSSFKSIWANQNNWVQKTVEKLATVVSGQVDPQIEPYASLPHINGESMQSGTGRLLSNYHAAKDDRVTSGKYHFMPGSLLYSKIRPYLRKAVQVPFEGICSADVYAFDRITPELEPRFFMYSLLSPPFTAYANSLSGRTRIPKLNQNQLFAFNMAFPPLPEQHHIVAYLDGLQTKVNIVERLQDSTEKELNALMPSILSRAFSGNL